MKTMTSLPVAIFSWLGALWAAFIFLSSLPYKFTGHPDTQHIFGTIGSWLEGFVGPLGTLFSQYGGYVIGTGELVVSLLLLAPGIFWVLSKLGLAKAKDRSAFHSVGGLGAMCLMLGAVFFHLASPLGIEVLHQGGSDGGSLFRAAVSIVIIGAALFLMNGRQFKNPF